MVELELELLQTFSSHAAQRCLTAKASCTQDFLMFESKIAIHEHLSVISDKVPQQCAFTCVKQS